MKCVLRRRELGTGVLGPANLGFSMDAHGKPSRRWLDSRLLPRWCAGAFQDATQCLLSLLTPGRLLLQSMLVKHILVPCAHIPLKVLWWSRNASLIELPLDAALLTVVDTTPRSCFFTIL